MFRAITSILAIITGVLGLWIITPELIRPEIVADAAYSPAQRARAKWAAWIGLVRGDLWTDYALASVGGLSSTTATPDNALIGRDLAERAVRLAPHDARAWLLLARTSGPAGQRDAAVAALLKMSYYTGPNEPSIFAPRLLLAARTGVSADPELSELVEREVQKIVTQKPELKPAIVTAYREGLPDARLVIERAVGEGDPAFLKQLQSGARRN
jgi:hypothetical protein